jgi:nickel-type superoxide dismutase maturation protease
MIPGRGTPSGRRLSFLLAVLLISLAARLTLGLGVVRGLSMWPSLCPGDMVVFARILGPVPGAVVVADLPEHGLIIKRVAVVEKGACFLLGDNREESYDSREFGPVPGAWLRGRVIAVWVGRSPSKPQFLSEGSPALSGRRALVSR